MLVDSTPFRLQVELAPEPRDVLWENVAMHGRERVIRKVMVFGILIFLVFFWIIPISYFSALTSVASLKNYFPWLMDLASKNKYLQQIIQGFVPTLAVVIFMAFVPLIVNRKCYFPTVSLLNLPRLLFAQCSVSLRASEHEAKLKNPALASKSTM